MSLVLMALHFQELEEPSSSGVEIRAWMGGHSELETFGQVYALPD
jgi:hypothetical protein